MIERYLIWTYKKEIKTKLKKEALEPTAIYVKEILGLVKKFDVKGIAHITGGGLYSNVKRILHDGLDIRIDWECIESQPIFNLMQQAGDVGIDEMRNTFNMGIGMVFIVGTEDADRVIMHLKTRSESAYVIGEVCK
ncbi:MAG: hypothetical protein KAS61_07925 [Spirochaetes bacterium]|nr:hypothetical protein [Spirochaetota bacterium]